LSEEVLGRRNVALKAVPILPNFLALGIVCTGATEDRAIM